MNTIESSGSPKTAQTKSGWLRRVVLGATFAAIGTMTLGAATTPAEAYWYHYGYYHPYYTYYPHYYGWRGYGYYPAYYGWGWGWHHHGWRRW